VPGPRGGHASSRGLRLAAPGDAGARRGDPPQAMAHHRVDGCPDGAVAQGRVWSRRVVDDVAHATCVTPARDEASGLEEVTAVGVVHARSSHEAMLPTPNMTQLSSRVCGMSAKIVHHYHPCVLLVQDSVLA